MAKRNGLEGIGLGNIETRVFFFRCADRALHGPDVHLSGLYVSDWVDTPMARAALGYMFVARSMKRGQKLVDAIGEAGAELEPISVRMFTMSYADYIRYVNSREKACADKEQKDEVFANAVGVARWRAMLMRALEFELLKDRKHNKKVIGAVQDNSDRKATAVVNALYRATSALSVNPNAVRGVNIESKLFGDGVAVFNSSTREYFCTDNAELAGASLLYLMIAKHWEHMATARVHDFEKVCNDMGVSYKDITAEVTRSVLSRINEDRHIANAVMFTPVSALKSVIEQSIHARQAQDEVSRGVEKDEKHVIVAEEGRTVAGEYQSAVVSNDLVRVRRKNRKRARML